MSQPRPLHAYETKPAKLTNCEQHGPFMAELIPTWNNVEYWASCPTCASERDQKIQEEARRESILEALGSANIPSRYVHAKFSMLSEKSALVPKEWLADVLADESEGALIIHGPPGTGKTFASCALLRHWIITTGGRWGQYTTCAGFCSEIRRTWSNRGGESEHQVFGRFRNARFLVLDDLGAGKAADLEILHELIDARYRDESTARTVIVTNVAPSNFTAAFGDRIADRLRDRGTLAPMLGKSKRTPLA